MLSLLIFIIVLSILIIAHEFGHYLAAKQAGVKVERFSIGFGPTLLKIEGKETQFLISLFPLGGYVKLAGDNRAECKGLEYEFFSKPAGIKSRIVVAGPLFNYFLAFLIFVGIGIIGGFLPYQSPIVEEVLKDYPAYSAGIKEGDRILEINGKRIIIWAEIAQEIQKSKEKVSIKLKRKGEIISLEVPLKQKEVIDSLGKKRTISVIGISSKRYGFFKAFFKAAEAMFNLTFLILRNFILMILGVIPFKKEITGFIGIYYFTAQAAKAGLIALLDFMALLNISLAIVNLFPLPILDGGHLIIFLVEKIRKKQISERAEDILTRIGFAIIGLLIVFIFYNDIVRFGPKIWNKMIKKDTEEVPKIIEE
jgi:regulator of sigma E protease